MHKAAILSDSHKVICVNLDLFDKADTHANLQLLEITECFTVCQTAREVDPRLECTPASGQGQAADLTICRACSC